MDFSSSDADVGHVDPMVMMGEISKLVRDTGVDKRGLEMGYREEGRAGIWRSPVLLGVLHNDAVLIERSLHELIGPCRCSVSMEFCKATSQTGKYNCRAWY